MSSENVQSQSSSEEEQKSEGFVVVSSESEEASSFEGENEEQEQNSEDFVPEDSKVFSESEVASSEVEKEEEQKSEDNVLDDSKPSSDTEGASSEEDQKSGSFVVVKSEVSSENEGALSEGEKEVMQNFEEIVSEGSKVSSDGEATSSSDEEKEEEQNSEEIVSESSKVSSDAVRASSLEEEKEEQQTSEEIVSESSEVSSDSEATSSPEEEKEEENKSEEIVSEGSEVTSDGVRASTPGKEKEEQQNSEEIVSEGSKVSSDSERLAPSLIEEGLQKEDTPAEDNEQSPPRQESFSVVVDLPMDDTPELQLGVEDIPLSKCNQVKYENKKGGCILTYCSEDEKEVVYVPLASAPSSSSSSSSSEEEVEVNHLLSDNEQSSPGKQDHTIVNVSQDDECEVCHRPTTEETGKLIKPCNCKGGEYTIHQECLKKEITESQERDFQCTKCLSKYNVEVHRNSVFQDLCSQGCLTVTIIVCTFFSIFCFISSFVYKLVPSFFFLAWGVFAVVLYAVEFCAFRLKRKRINYFVVFNKKQRKQRC